MGPKIDRRVLLAGLTAFAAAGPAQAITTDRAVTLINQVVRDINSVINSGKSEQAMYGDFERIFLRYGDVPIIARSTLGPVAREVTSAQLNAFADAFGGYLSRKYGARFREFIGGQIEVVRAREVKNWYEVDTVARLRGQAPFSVVFRVSDRSGQDRFFDLVIEGISLGKTERTEIQALLDQRRGNVDQLIQDLRGLS
ncbi:MAG: ABC transporter substrate-binding protein [Pseudomonadota bacterium]